MNAYTPSPAVKPVTLKSLTVPSPTNTPPRPSFKKENYVCNSSHFCSKQGTHSRWNNTSRWLEGNQLSTSSKWPKQDLLSANSESASPSSQGSLKNDQHLKEKKPKVLHLIKNRFCYAHNYNTYYLPDTWPEKDGRVAKTSQNGQNGSKCYEEEHCLLIWSNHDNKLPIHNFICMWPEWNWQRCRHMAFTTLHDEACGTRL